MQNGTGLGQKFTKHGAALRFKGKRTGRTIARGAVLPRLRLQCMGKGARPCSGRR